MAIRVDPISPILGAYVHNLTLSDKPESIKKIRDLLAQYLVLVFENQNLTTLQFRDIVAKFGPLFIHHSDEGVLVSDEAPEVLEMKKEPDSTRLFGGSDWHADVTFRKPEGFLSVLYSKIIPPIGGDTAFASNIAAYDALSEGMKELLKGLKAVHSYNGPGQPDHPSESAVHDIVRIHPDTGKAGLYINKMFVTRFDGMTAAESKPLIDYLDAHMSSPQFTCRISWNENQVVMWDNRFTLHYPINDFSGHLRLLQRCTALCS